jgi:hypothetical protein
MTHTSKTLKLTSKRKADQMLANSLFTPGGTLTRFKYCTGKYKPEKFPVGKEMEVGNDIQAIWAERRRDEHGPHVVLYCLFSR